MSSTDLHVVVPAGGSGTRLWPLSRAANPKFLHALTGTDRSLLQATFDRLAPLSTADRLLVVTGTAHATSVIRQLPELPERNILVEPFARDSCAAIALAAAVIEQRSPGAVMASFAADHLITNTPAFTQTVRQAVEGAAAGRLMTIGITPTRPETGFGYLRLGAPAEPGTVQTVLEFKEKPTAEVAEEYVAAGYLWNASMFLWRTDVFLAELAARRPDVHDPIRTIAEAWDGDDQESVLAEAWPTIPKVAVEYAVMEPAATEGKVSTVPGDFGWNDIGDFETLGELLGRKVEGARVVDVTSESPPVLVVDGDGVIAVPTSSRVIATLGVTDLIVVDTEDAVLVCRRDRAQDIKKLTELLRERGHAAHV